VFGGEKMNTVNNEAHFKPLAKAGFSDTAIFTGLVAPETQVLEAGRDGTISIKIMIDIVNEAELITDILNHKPTIIDFIITYKAL
jgi:hypothetical protein